MRSIAFTIVALGIYCSFFSIKMIPSFSQVSFVGKNTIVVDAGLDDIAKTLLSYSSPLTRQIIGQNDLLNVEFLNQMTYYAKSVARISVPETEFCPNQTGTGFLISDSILITNNHVLCSVEQSKGATVEFNYQLGRDKKPLPVDRYTINGSFFYTNENLDYTIVKLNGKQIGNGVYLPGEIFGFVNLSDYAQAGKGNKTSIIQYPGGGYKQVALLDGNVQSTIPSGLVLYTSDTQHGSSGSPVFNANAQLIALHHYQGEEDVDGTFLNNEGIMIGKIIEDLKSKFSSSEEGRKLLEEMNLK